MSLRGGTRVIEEGLYRRPAVAEAIVIGTADDYRGQVPKAFVRLRPGSTAKPDDLKAFLGDQISKIEMPKVIELRDHLPKTSIGKLSRKGLVAEEVLRADSLPARRSRKPPERVRVEKKRSTS